MNNRSLLCVFNGEFGWEVAQWQGKCRKESRKYRKTFILTDEGHGFLYKDFAEIIDHKNVTLPRTHSILAWRKDSIYKDSDQEFRKFGVVTDNKYDIVIHARSSSITFKNYSVEQWCNVLSCFKGLKIASIGSLGGAFHIKGTDDLRGIDLCDLSDVMASSKIVVGPSSGPIHLAQHCATKVLVWGDNKIYVGHNTIRQRIESTWNPFSSESIVIDSEGWDPHPESIIKILLKEV